MTAPSTLTEPGGVCSPVSRNTQIDAAAIWLTETPRDKRGGPAVPELKRRFGLTAVEAIEAIRAANDIRARSA